MVSLKNKNTNIYRSRNLCTYLFPALHRRKQSHASSHILLHSVSTSTGSPGSCSPCRCTLFQVISSPTSLISWNLRECFLNGPSDIVLTISHTTYIVVFKVSSSFEKLSPHFNHYLHPKLTPLPKFFAKWFYLFRWQPTHPSTVIELLISLNNLQNSQTDAKVYLIGRNFIGRNFRRAKVLVERNFCH